MEEAKNKLYVGNLAYEINDEKLKEIFSAAGEVTEAVVIMDKISGRSKGFGFVTMKDDAAAEKAIEQLNETDLEGRKIIVNVARPMRER
ncbi:MAG: RNA-binding protein [Candidatus Pacebacteria bacterium]|nr:RNA-binding protein [Candidatus Paceibacterota bacterium]